MAQAVLSTIGRNMLPPPYLPSAWTLPGLYSLVPGSAMDGRNHTLSVSADKHPVAPKFQALPWTPRGPALGSTHEGREAYVGHMKPSVGYWFHTKQELREPGKLQPRAGAGHWRALEVEGWDSGNIKCSKYMSEAVA